MTHTKKEIYSFKDPAIGSQPKFSDAEYRSIISLDQEKIKELQTRFAIFSAESLAIALRLPQEDVHKILQMQTQQKRAQNE